MYIENVSGTYQGCLPATCLTDVDYHWSCRPYRVRLKWTTFVDYTCIPSLPLRFLDDSLCPASLKPSALHNFRITNLS